MKAYYCIDHDNHYPVGAASVVVAEDANHAIELLDAALVKDGLKPYDQHEYTLVEIEMSTPHAVILVNGDY